jgi:predicted MarR family transcription regulator
MSMAKVAAGRRQAPREKAAAVGPRETAAAPLVPPAVFTPSELSRELSEFEFALLTLMFGFHSWTEMCMAAADVRGLSSMDILVLHAVNHRARSRRQSEICMVLNIDDSHLVAYSLKKLMAAGLVSSLAEGRERRYETTERGEAACIAYRKVREEFLVPNLSWVAGGERVIHETASFLRTMSALYAQAGRFATAATAGQKKSPPLHTKR